MFLIILTWVIVWWAWWRFWAWFVDELDVEDLELDAVDEAHLMQMKTQSWFAWRCWTWWRLSLICWCCWTWWWRLRVFDLAFWRCWTSDVEDSESRSAWCCRTLTMKILSLICLSLLLLVPTKITSSTGWTVVSAFHFSEPANKPSLPSRQVMVFWPWHLSFSLGLALCWSLF